MNVHYYVQSAAGGHSDYMTVVMQAMQVVLFMDLSHLKHGAAPFLHR
jgi:hypothetical protein